MSTRKKETTTSFTCLELLIVLAIFWLPLALWTDRNLDFWLSQFSNKVVDVPFWLSGLVALFGNGVVILGNLIGEIGRLCL